MENERSCPACDTYQLCKTYDRLPQGEVGCDDWEPARDVCERSRGAEHAENIEQNKTLRE